MNTDEMLRLNDLWQRLKNTDKPIVLYGQGDGADKIINECERHGIIISGVFASDDFVRHQTFRGFTVCSYGELKAEFGDVVVLLAFGTHRPEVMDNVKKIMEEQEVFAPDVPVDEKGGIVSNYEVILFPEDYNGGVMVDGVFYQSLSGYFVCCQPAQHRKFKLPVRCYILGISTQDPQLNAALKSLPPYAPHPNLPVLMDLFRKFLYIPTHTAITDRLAVYASTAAFLQLL